MVHRSTALDHAITRQCLKDLHIPETDFPRDLQRGFFNWQLPIPLTERQWRKETDILFWG